MKEIRPDLPSKQFQKAREQWVLVDDIWGGTKRLRECGETYLPKEPKEPQKGYESRLERSFLLNGYKRTIQYNVGKVFSDDIDVKDYNSQLQPVVDDADRNGNNLSQFAQKVFQDALNHGVSYVLVDYPEMKNVRNLAEERELNPRPYLVHIKSIQALDARCEVADGTKVLTQFRMEEYVTEYSTDPNDFSDNIVKQIRIYRRDLELGTITYELWRQNKDEKWYLYREPTLILGVSQIPVIAIYTNRQGFYVGSPALYDLAEVTIQHWQSSSDQRNILHIARVPFIFAKMIGLNEDLAIAANTIIEGQSPESDMKFVEHSGKAIEAGRQDLLDLQATMAIMGLELSMPNRPGNETATKTAINTAEQNSLLKAMALSLKDALEQVLIICADFLGLDPTQAGSVIVNTDFALPYQDVTQMQYLLDMYKEGIITAIDVFEEAQRRNILHPDVEYVEPQNETTTNETIGE